MVNDKVFGRQQIPVEFEGKTITAAVRVAWDVLKMTVPYAIQRILLQVMEVDKALAFIIEGAEGEALYFKSIETAQKYHKDVKTID